MARKRKDTEVGAFDREARKMGMRYADLQKLKSLNKMDRIRAPRGYTRIKDRKEMPDER